MISLSVHRLSPEVKLPEYSTNMSACFDLFYSPTTDTLTGYDKNNDPFTRKNLFDDSFYIRPGDRILVPTGLVMKLRLYHSVETFADITREKEELRQFSIRLHSNNDLALRSGIMLANTEGIVDVDYQEQIYVLLHNISEANVVINKHTKIAMGEVLVNELVQIAEINDMPLQYKA